MLKALLRVRLEALKSWVTGSSRTKKAQSKGKLIGFLFLMVYAFGAMGFLFWHIFNTIALPFHMYGMDWLYFSLAALMAFALMFIGSIFTAKAQLYEARDNDLLLSLPIKPGYILFSRMFMLWVISFAMELITVVPAFIVWLNTVSFIPAGLAGYLIIFILLLPLFALTVSALFGWLLSVISARLGGKSFVTVILSVAFLGAYMYWAARMEFLIGALAQNPDGVAGALGAVAPLVWIGQAAAEGSLTALGKTALLMLGAFVLCCWLLSKTFIKTATGKRGAAKKKYVEHEEKTASPRKALFQRELRRFLSSSSYMMNCGLGAIFALIGAGALLVKQDELSLLLADPDMLALMQLMFAAGLCFMAAMTTITAPSISLEGKNLWIAQSLPVEAKDILLAKLKLHLLFAVPPMLVCSAAAAYVLKTDALLTLCFFLLSAVFSVFVGLLGLNENLRHPNFDWMTETQAVKSGISVLFTMLISWGLILIPVLAYAFFGEVISGAILCLVFLAVLTALCLLLYRWLMRRGAEIYRGL